MKIIYRKIFEKRKKSKSIQKTQTGFLFSNRVKLTPTLSAETILYDELLLGPRRQVLENFRKLISQKDYE